MQKAIVIGASSGIGRELAKVLAREGFEVGLIARRLQLLQDLQSEISTPTYIRQIDVTHTSEAQQSLNSLIREMGEVDLIIVNAGVFLPN